MSSTARWLADYSLAGWMAGWLVRSRLVNLTHLRVSSCVLMRVSRWHKRRAHSTQSQHRLRTAASAGYLARAQCRDIHTYSRLYIWPRPDKRRAACGKRAIVHEPQCSTMVRRKVRGDRDRERDSQSICRYDRSK